MTHVARLFVVLAVTSACGGGGDGDDGIDLPPDLDQIADRTAAGTIAGTSFTLGTRFMNVTDGELFVDLLQDVATDCTKDETQASTPFIIFFTPAQAGRYELGDSQFVTFVDKPSSNLIVGNGVIEIDEITETTVTGGLHVFDPEHGEINGRFDGQLCFRR